MNSKEGKDTSITTNLQERKLDEQIAQIENENSLLVQLENQINVESEKLNVEKKALQEKIKQLQEQKKEREQKLKKNNMY
ncbi:hypothetical protein TTHERM_000148919 (macronuclear) [Tetrahymena thermophila SB210]|uniref:Uncharacterized protein n=1 Tax=Tetrahymena thermophila (strain SB210) TaxID=312017 RepID=W7X1C0_TETTS|nr:hypothetical protein TTHERM_000148919 [Tetrahymena thermophila SB210]EWS73020.1 hypothetical protein TTHERM_000148919 [Tetrahymena thermophila SB210]|eukprot:XP_012654417.1 hypothetical protein TTHERM_000148919 [Tetrahymena thermophila SB210]